VDIDLSEVRARRDRSPSFPFISLPRAIERARDFASAHKRGTPRLGTVAPTWGYASKSSGLLQSVSALKAFGLLEDSGSGDDRKASLAELAWRILLDARPGAREQAIREAALKPRLIGEYAATWGGDRPDDSHCISELQFDRGFSDSAARTFLKVFDETMIFANLGGSDSIPTNLQEGGKLVSQSSERAQAVSKLATAPVMLDVVGFGPRPAHNLSTAAQSALSERPRATLPLPEGMAAIELPDGLSEDSLQDVREWIEVLLRRMERAAKRTQHGPAEQKSPLPASINEDDTLS
jgi:hypothetical protein